MKILLDECVPWPMHRILLGHVCMTAQACGWTGIQNGALLRLAEPVFDLFITSDQSIAYQQNLASREIAIIQLSTNKIRRIKAAETMVQNAVNSIKAGEFVKLQIP